MCTIPPSSCTASTPLVSTQALLLERISRQTQTAPQYAECWTVCFSSLTFRTCTRRLGDSGPGSSEGSQDARWVHRCVEDQELYWSMHGPSVLARLQARSPTSSFRDIVSLCSSGSRMSLVPCIPSLVLWALPLPTTSWKPQAF